MTNAQTIPTDLDSYGRIWKAGRKPRRYDGYGDRVKKLQRHISRGSCKSIALTADSGAGKTALLHTFFCGLADQGWTIIETSTTEMMSGTAYVGEWQTRLIAMLEQAAEQPNHLIYIKDIQNLKGAGTSSKSDADMAAAITPFLERGEVILIGECTMEAFRHGVEACPALKNQLTLLQMEPLSDEKTAAMIRYAFDDIQNRVQREREVTLALPESSLVSLQQLGKIYFSGIAQPGAAIKLLESTVDTIGHALDEEMPASGSIELTQSDIVATLNRVSGLPIHLLDDNIPLNLHETRKFFDARLVGQNGAVTTVTDVITLIKAGLTDPGKPTAIMLFAGPTGVGKTELAKALAEFLFGNKERMIRCDMSEYKDYASYEKFLGRSSEKEDPNSLVNQVRRQPFSVILLDEVEKAHPNIFDVLLQAFDDGRLTDTNGNTTDLTQSIIIMTSNLGSDLSRPKPVGFDSAGPKASELVDKALRGFFRPEFLNRIDHIIRFLPLREDHLRTLAKRELGKALLRNGLIRRELRVSVEPEVHDLLASEGYDELYGARPLRRKVETLAVLPVARVIVGLGSQNRGSLLQLFVDDGGIGVRLIEDRQTRTAQRMVRGLTVVDPGDGTKTRVTLPEIEEGIERLVEKVGWVETRAEQEEFHLHKEILVDFSGHTDFWDHQARAREVLSQIYRFERLIEGIARTQRESAALCDRLEYLKRDPSEAGLRQISIDLQQSARYARLIHHAVECREAEELRDAYLLIRRAGEGIEGDDLVYDLADCYRRWCDHNEYSFRIIHEESGESGIEEIIAEVGGPAACGILMAEEGEHEFVFEKTGPVEPRRTAFLSVRVFGVPIEGAVTKPTLKKQSTSQESRFGAKIRTRISARCRKTKTAIELLSPLTGAELEDDATGFLQAKSERGETIDNGIVRRYTMRPSRVVEDYRAADLEIDARGFWKGRLDDVLHIGVLSRKKKAPTSK